MLWCLIRVRCLQITFFAAIMTINKRRELARRWDVIMCVKIDRPIDQPRTNCCKEKPSTKIMRLLGSILARRPAQVRADHVQGGHAAMLPSCCHGL